MKQLWQTQLKPVLKNAGLDVPWRWFKRKIWALQLVGKDPKQIFTEIYNDNKWECEESISGPGSTLEETAHLRPELEKLFRELEIKTIIDLPCGDFHWFKEIDYAFDHYTGCDIVEPLIAKNNEKYASPARSFKVLNVLEDRLDQADMFFCRDLLLHLSYKNIFDLFDNVLKSDIEWILVSHGVGLKNEDIHTGQGRLVNLTAPPFNFPEPQKIIMENSKVFGGKFKDIRSMALWRVADLRDHLGKNR
ncbi:MAG: class I SAM-dependent methyltransferase [Alphaproteobacteria bacterium]|nr:class I SAM-dependent methyltransferase [Alphaproteobacteria bacterium]MCD8570401.1 class I SAM-dependent methyltransferase [Alphaproteobacteria bacterium]